MTKIIDSTNRLYQFGIIVIILVSVAAYAQSTPKTATAILFEGSQVWLDENFLLNVTKIDILSLRAHSVQFQGLEKEFRKGDIVVAKDNSYRLLVRDFIFLNGKPAIIVKQEIFQPTGPYIRKTVFTSFLPVKSTETGIPKQIVSPIPTRIGEQLPPFEVEELTPEKISFSSLEEYFYAKSTLAKPYLLLEENRTNRDIAYRYGEGDTGYLKYKELEGYLVHYDGIVNGRKQDLYVLLQKDVPLYVVDLPDRKFVFELYITPEQGIYKVIWRCVGWSCTRLD